MSIENRVLELVRSFQSDRSAAVGKLGREVELYQGGLGWDSLDAAEFSARLEAAFGADPYSEGVFPNTVGDIVGFYESRGT
ncbi:MAG: hypothetical protein Q8N51_18050 [Gammaproteobacteria bacterium]|nr:hypothetical protein [Gammaproteobacteria bacterium]